MKEGFVANSKSLCCFSCVALVYQIVLFSFYQSDKNRYFFHFEKQMARLVGCEGQIKLEEK
jgi:hypothetical protein